MRVALVHEYITQMGGAERVLQVLHEMYPNAPIYTFLWNEALRPHFPHAQIRTSFLRRFPRLLQRHRKYLLPLLTVAPETFDLSPFDLVISSSSAFAKGVIVKPRTLHVCYCHAPSRFLWDGAHEYLAPYHATLRGRLIRPYVHYLRMWDRAAGERVDHFIANSQYTRAQIGKYYRRDAHVIYPPVSMPQQPGELPQFKKETYFLIVSRLVAYKRIDIAIEAFNKLELPLLVIGDGPERARLARLARQNVKVVGPASDEEVRRYFMGASGFVFPGEDDFGMTMPEAMSFGVPVLAYRKGGALEIVEEGVTGEFFDDPTPEVLADGVRRLRERLRAYDRRRIAEAARRFSRESFEREFRTHIAKLLVQQRNHKGVPV